MSRKTHNVPGAIVFTVEHLFSPAECQELLTAANDSGFLAVDWEYLKSYRDCTRALLDSRPFADKIWAKILPFLEQDDLLVRPFGIGTEGTWIPKGVNSRLRISKYGEGGHFSPHRDSGFVITDDLRSIFTILIYLNEDFTGGETTFFPVTGIEPCLSITPTVGTAVVFTHDARHAGTSIITGNKYVLRTDIMFHAMDKHEHKQDNQYHDNPTYLAAEQSYQLSIAEQNSGRPGPSTVAFVNATELHAQSAPSVPKLFEKGSFANLQAELFRKITSLLGLPDLLNLALAAKRFRLLVTKDTILWRSFYMRDSVGTTTECVPLEINSHLALTYDWYNLYRYGILVQRKFRPLIVDVGSRYTRYCFLGNEPVDRSMKHLEPMSDVFKKRVLKNVFQHPIGIIRSVFHRQQGHYWGAGEGYGEMFLRSESDDEEYHPKESQYDHLGNYRENYRFLPYATEPPFEPKYAQWNGLLDFILQNQNASRIEHCPAVFVLPPFAMSAQIEEEITQDMIAEDSRGFRSYSALNVSYLALLDSASCAVAFHGRTSAIVISCGARFIWVCPVNNLKMAFDETERRESVIAIESPKKLDSYNWLTETNLRKSLVVACDRCPAEPVILCGGQTNIVEPYIREILPETTVILRSEMPENDIIRGAQVRTMLPGSRDMFKKRPVEINSWNADIIRRLDFDKVYEKLKA